VTKDDLLQPLKTYQAHVTQGLVQLVGDIAPVKDAVHRGDRAGAQAAWLTAHLTYERLGAAYGAFGAADRALNGTTAGLPGGVTDPGFTGFHRLEHGLWHGEDLGALGAVVDRLDADAHALQQSFSQSQVDGNDLGLRAHEIVENACQFELTARTDYGSGTNLATARANLDGVQTVLDVLRPVLTPRFPQLSTVDSWMKRAEAVLGGARRPDGSWTPVGQLGAQQHQKVNGDLAQLTEQLAPIAAIAEPRRVS
jgi:iron uptake system component EfeO